MLDRLKDVRSRLYASARFQSFCARFWLTRPIARANAASVFDLCAGFVYSQILFTCVRFDLLSLLHEKALTLEDAALHICLPLDATERLFKAAVAIDILEKRSGGRFGLGPVGAAVLGNAGLQGMILHHAHLYTDLADPVGLLKERSTKTELANYWAYSRATEQTDEPPQYVQDYSALMSQTLNVIAEEIINAYPLGCHTKLLDVGGGDGAFIEAVSARVKDLELALFDLPPVAQLAAKRFDRASTDVDITGGNMFEDEWPLGADLISLVRVALDHDDAAVQEIYQKARQALAPGATLLIAEPMSDSPRVGDAYFGFYLWAMGSGRARTIAEHRKMLASAGFQSVKVVNTSQPILLRVLIAS
jgi:demethylspheroidene O-methyltransferase